MRQGRHALIRRLSLFHGRMCRKSGLQVSVSPIRLFPKSVLFPSGNLRGNRLGRIDTREQFTRNGRQYSGSPAYCSTDLTEESSTQLQLIRVCGSSLVGYVGWTPPWSLHRFAEMLVLSMLAVFEYVLVVPATYVVLP